MMISKYTRACWIVLFLARTISGSVDTKLGLCQMEADCDFDSDCQNGLMCADAHKKELEVAGHDSRKANCPYSDTGKKYLYFEVCFDPKILTRTTGGAGGDPHFRTYDGTKYSFHGQCDLVMARSRTFGNGLGLDLHIRTEIKLNWSFISNVAVRIGGDIFEASAKDDASYYNGVQMKLSDFPFIMEGKYVVLKTESVQQISLDKGNETEHHDARQNTKTSYIIQLGNDDLIGITLYKNILSVRVAVFLNDTEGMLGVHDGTQGMVGRDHVTILNDPIMMGKEWQVNETEPLLFQDDRAPQYPEGCILPAGQFLKQSKTERRRLRIHESNYDIAKEACATIIDQDMHDFCVDDVMFTGDADLAQGYTEEAF